MVDKIIRIAAVLLALALFSGCRQAEPEHRIMNLVMICIDTVRSDTFWANDDSKRPDALSPWLETALQYRNAQSSSSWTIPAVASVFTGLYPSQHGAGRFQRAVANLSLHVPARLGDELDTLTEHLQTAGFNTGAFAAHPFITSDYGLNQGFDITEPRGGWKKNVEAFANWLDGARWEHEGAPFFGYLHFMEAHDWHLKSTGELQQRLEGLPDETRDWLRSSSSEPACADPEDRMCLRNQVYILAVLEQRLAIARILETLQQKQLLDSTIVVLYSDHGEEFWEHREEAKASGNDPRGYYGSGHGQSLYQELLHVPLVAWRPGVKGAVINTLTSLVDVYPSLLKWVVNIDAGQDYPGAVLPLKNRRRDNRSLYASGIAYGPEMIASRESDKKAIWDLRRDNIEYFDLRRDPAEKEPLQSDQLILRFDTLLGDYQELQPIGAGTEIEITSAQLERLKSIGYLQGLESEEEAEAADTEAAAEDGESQPQ